MKQQALATAILSKPYLVKQYWSAKEGITDEAARACYSSTFETQTTSHGLASRKKKKTKAIFESQMTVFEK